MLHLAATTGARRGEICALRRSHFDRATSSLRVERGIVKHHGRKVDGPTKNRRRRTIALDPRSVQILTSRIEQADDIAATADVRLIADPYLFALDLRGEEPWDPDTITQFFGRLRRRLALDGIEFKGLRRFTDTYGQELGFSLAQVSVRTGHDPAVAAKHYTGRVVESDRHLAEAIGNLIEPNQQLAETDSEFSPIFEASEHPDFM
ncbi:MAG: tyrosine-type recombinase/integrase [Actinomycetota bacterium]